MPAIDTTIHELRELYRSHQRPGTNIATVFGVALFAWVLADAFSNAAGNRSFTGFLLSSLEITNYHAIFVIAVFLQIAALIAGFVLLRRSKWQSAAAYDTWNVLKDAWIVAKQRRSVNKSAWQGQPLAFWVIAPLLLVTFACGLVLMNHAAHLLFQPFLAVVLAVMFAAALAWDLTTVLVVARRDIYVVAGLFITCLLIAIGLAYGPNQLLEPGSWGEDAAVPDMQYWEALIFGIVAIGLLPLLIERKQEVTICLLHLERRTVPPGVSPLATFAEESGRPISVMFSLVDVKVIGLYGTRGVRELRILNLSDPQLRVPLHGHSLLLWNLSSLEQMAGSGSAVLDSAGCFSAIAELRTMATAASFRAREGVMLDPVVVDLASDLIFNNVNLFNFLHQVGTTVFESAVAAFSTDVRQVRGALDAMIPKIHLDATTPVPRQLIDQINSSSHAEVRQAQMHYVGTRFVDELGEHRAKLNLAVENARLSLQRAESAWLPTVHKYFDERIRTSNGASSVSEHQIKDLMNALGIQLGFGSFSLVGAAAECGPLISKIEGEIIVLSGEKEQRFREAMQRREEQQHELQKSGLAHPLMGPRMTIELLERMNALPQKHRPPSDPLPKEKEPEQLN